MIANMDTHHNKRYRYLIHHPNISMGKVIIITESTQAFCEECEKEFTPRIKRKIHTCPACRYAVTGADDVPLRGPNTSRVIRKTIIHSDGRVIKKDF